MTFLPIVERELRVAARLTSTYRNRSFTAMAVAVVAIIMIVFGMFASSPSEVGRASFGTLSCLTLVFCLLEGLRKTADCLSGEKREGTLGLLFLTDLRSYDIILGKLVATSLNSIYGLLAILPILALPLLLGGVTMGEFWRMVLALSIILLFSLCAGIRVSSWTRRERNAMGATLLTITLVTATPLLLSVFVHAAWIPHLSPLSAFLRSPDTDYRSAPQDFWWPIGLALVWSLVLLVLATLTVPHFWQDERTGRTTRRWQPRRPENPAKEQQRRAQMLDINPAYWLAGGRKRNPRLTLIFLVGGALANSITLAMLPNLDYLVWLVLLAWTINFLMKMLVAGSASQCLAEARENNSLEMLLVTPLSTPEMIQGQLLALKRIFLLPIILIIAIEIGGMFFAASFQKPDAEAGAVISMTVGWLVYLGMSALDIFAGMWAGMWFGLTSKGASHARTKTILLTLLLPLACFMLCFYGLPFVIGVPIFLIIWCRYKLRTEFRNVVALQHTPNRGEGGWLPGTSNEKPFVPSV